MVLPAGAVPEPVSAAVDGSFTTPAGTFPLTDAVFQGTWDADTGALEGQFLFPATTIDVTSPTTATIGLQLQQPSVSTGTIDLATNVATFNTTLVLALLTVDAAGSGPISIAPCNYSSAVQLTGTFDPATGDVSFEDADISLAAVNDPNRCFYEITGASIASIIDPEVVGQGSAFDATFNVQDASAPPPAEPCEFNVEIPADDPACVEPTTAPPPPAAPPADAVGGNANFTG
jgi:hypothetical protein